MRTAMGCHVFLQTTFHSRGFVSMGLLSTLWRGHRHCNIPCKIKYLYLIDFFCCECLQLSPNYQREKAFPGSSNSCQVVRAEYFHLPIPIPTLPISTSFFDSHGCFNGSPCPVASRWIWPTGSSNKRSKKEVGEELGQNTYSPASSLTACQRLVVLLN